MIMSRRNNRRIMTTKNRMFLESQLRKINSNVDKELDDAYNGSYYTIVGAGGDLNEWVEGYEEMLNEQGIGTPEFWITFNGRDVNNKYDLSGDNRFNNSLTFLAFPLDGLNVGKLAMFKLRMGDRWFDDIIDNSR